MCAAQPSRANRSVGQAIYRVLMSTNIGVCFTVYDLEVDDAEVIGELFEQAVREERLEDDVIVAYRDDEDRATRDVRAVSQELVIFSRFYMWRPKFEESLQRRVTEAVPQAVVSFEWHYPDED